MIQSFFFPYMSFFFFNLLFNHSYVEQKIVRYSLCLRSHWLHIILNITYENIIFLIDFFFKFHFYVHYGFRVTFILVQHTILLSKFIQIIYYPFCNIDQLEVYSLHCNDMMVYNDTMCSLHIASNIARMDFKTKLYE